MFSHHIIAYPTLQSKSEIVYNPTHSNEKPYFLKLYTIKYRQRISLYFPMFFIFLYRIFVRSMRLSSATFFVSFLTKSGSSSASFPSLRFRLFFGLAYAAFAFKTFKACSLQFNHHLLVFIFMKTRSLVVPPYADLDEKVLMHASLQHTFSFKPAHG